MTDDPTLEAMGARTFRDVMRMFTPRDPRYRYWETPDGWQFHYTTEKMGDGKYASAQYQPVGKGARSGKKNITRLSVRREVHHTTRRAARARAYKLFQKHQAELAGRTK